MTRLANGTIAISNDDKKEPGFGELSPKPGLRLKPLDAILGSEFRRMLQSSGAEAACR